MLEIHGIETYYGETQALFGVSLEVRQGEAVALLGPNGAGKTTVLRSILGLTPARRGSVRFTGKDITGQAPEQTARLGFSMVPEGREVFGSLSVDENLRVGTGMRADKDQCARDLETIYAVFPVLKDRREVHAGLLSGGQQQMLVISRALMASPRLIAIDEPSLGLAPKVVDDVYAALLKLRDTRGLTLLVVEQSAIRAGLAGGRMIVMRSGEKVLEGNARELVQSEALKQAYFGYGELPCQQIF